MELAHLWCKLMLSRCNASQSRNPGRSWKSVVFFHLLTASGEQSSLQKHGTALGQMVPHLHHFAQWFFVCLFLQQTSSHMIQRFEATWLESSHRVDPHDGQSGCLDQRFCNELRPRWMSTRGWFNKLKPKWSHPAGPTKNYKSATSHIWEVALVTLTLELKFLSCIRLKRTVTRDEERHLPRYCTLLHQRRRWQEGRLCYQVHLWNVLKSDKQAQALERLKLICFKHDLGLSVTCVSNSKPQHSTIFKTHFPSKNKKCLHPWLGFVAALIFSSTMDENRTIQSTSSQPMMDSPWRTVLLRRAPHFSIFFPWTFLGGGFIFFYVHPYLGKWSNLTNIFQMGWNHQQFPLLIHISNQDLVSYNDKHNTCNGENSGDDHNNSWNCGHEGETGQRSQLPSISASLEKK